MMERPIIQGTIIAGGYDQKQYRSIPGRRVRTDTVYAATQVASVLETISGNKTTSTFTGGWRTIIWKGEQAAQTS